MGDWRRCLICGEHGCFGMKHNPDHVCAPIWEARIFTRDGQEEWTAVHAHDAEGAAAKFCERHDQNGEYDIVRRGGEEIEVRVSEGGTITMVDVSAETVPHYYAHTRKSAEAV